MTRSGDMAHKGHGSKSEEYHPACISAPGALPIRTSTSHYGGNPIFIAPAVPPLTIDSGVKVTRADQRVDGTSIHYSFTFKYDGKEYPVTGAPFDTISCKRLDANTTTCETKNTGGKLPPRTASIVSRSTMADPLGVASTRLSSPWSPTQVTLSNCPPPSGVLILVRASRL